MNSDTRQSEALADEYRKISRRKVNLIEVPTVAVWLHCSRSLINGQKCDHHWHTDKQYAEHTTSAYVPDGSITTP